MSKDIFKKAFFDQLEKDGISKTAGCNILNEIHEFSKESCYAGYMEKVGIVQGLLEVPRLLGRLGWGLGLGTVGLGIAGGLANVFRNQGRVRKKYMRERLIDDPIEDLLKKIKEMEQIEEI